jgi:tRNA-splicing ligase RtcB
MKQINDKLLSFASTLEDEALHQAIITSHLPFIHGHVALMPDAHYGMGSTIGSVIPTVGAVVPAAVGVDIGCGMIAVKTQLVKRDLAGRDLSVLRHSIERSVPLSVGKGNKTITESAQRRIGRLEAKAKKHYSQFADWRHQLGSLGSGNHFIEASLDEDDNVWLFLHSGSRGVGNKIAQHHIKVAQAVCKRWSVHLEDPDLAYLTDQTDEFDDYIHDLLWAQDFALANREEIMDRVINELAHFVHGDIQELERINCLAGETRVITMTGIRDIRSLAGSKHELLTAGGEWVEAPVCSFGKQHLMKVELSRNGVKNTIYATAEHRWLLRTHGETGSRYAGSREEKMTSELVQGDRLAYVFATQQSMSIVQEAAVRGFVYGDGSYNGRKSHANFCGDKDEALLGLFANYLPPREYENFKRINGLPLEWKTERPSLGIDASYLYRGLFNPRQGRAVER